MSRSPSPGPGQESPSPFDLSRERWSQADDLLSDLLNLPPAVRDSALHRACVGDPDLFDLVVRLLRYAEESLPGTPRKG